MSDGKYQLRDNEALIYGSDSAQGAAEYPFYSIYLRLCVSIS